MPLSDIEQRCLNYISGDDGIVSSVGKAVSINGRGDITRYEMSNAKSLNILSRVFFKAEIKSPVYTSLIQNENYKIVLSYMGCPPHHGLQNDQVEALYNIIKYFEGDDTGKIQIFRKMYECTNDILQQKLIDRCKEEQVKMRKGQTNDFDFFNKAKDYCKNETHAQEILDHPLFRQFALENFDVILPNFQLAADLLRENFSGIDYLMNTKSLATLYGSMHVEVKGIHYLQQEYPDSRIFTLGLAKKDNKEPGCCVGCATELNAVSRIKGEYLFDRTADFMQNFPPKNYKPSFLVTEESSVFQEFARNIRTSLNTTITTNPGNELLLDHPFFVNDIPEPIYSKIDTDEVELSSALTDSLALSSSSLLGAEYSEQYVE